MDVEMEYSMTDPQSTRSVTERINAGQLDDILARIDAAYAVYKQTPVFTCQEEELAFWSRTAPAVSDENPTQLRNQQPDQ